MINQLVEAAVICLCIAGVAYFVGIAIAAIVEQRVLRKLRSAAVDERLRRLSLLASRFRSRREEILPRMIRLDAQVKSVRRRHYMVQKKVSDLSSPRSALIRVLGEEDAFLRTDKLPRRFIATVINRHVHRSQMEQKEHPMFAPSWARPQRVYAWAPSIGDAKVLVERAFPPATGFFISEISEPGDEAEMTDDLDVVAAIASPLAAKA